MRYRVLSALMVLAAGAAGAQSISAPQPSDTWSRPASAGTAAYDSMPRRDAGAGKDIFKFRDRRPQLPPVPSRGNHPIDKAPVTSGMPRIGADGRPALNCMQSPMDSRCR